MRLWSLHPDYLDAKGLVALWREGLLAKKVLEGGTIGYTNHPQLDRFKKCKNPCAAINQYLDVVLKAAKQRGYNFDETKIKTIADLQTLPVNDKQLAFESKHLLQKLMQRDFPAYEKVKDTHIWLPHPMFIIVPGEIEDWERVERSQ